MNAYSISLSSFPEKLLDYQGEKKIWLGGTNYLSIGSHPLFKEKLAEGLSRYPQNWGSSRKNNLQLEVFEKFEQLFAEKFPGKGIALCSSGMAAAQTALYFIQKNEPEISVNLAPYSHPALWTPQAKRSQSSYQEWAESIDDQAHQCLCSDGIGAPLVQEFDLTWIKSSRKKTYIVIDESHRLGLMDMAMETESPLIQTASLSKAYGIPAGIIIGPENWIKELKNDPFWVGSSPPNPAFIYACLHAQEAYVERQQTLNTQLEYLDSIFPVDSNQKIQRIKHYPGFSSHHPALFEHLIKDGFLTNHFAYPNIRDQAICKGIIHPLLSQNELERLVASMIHFNQHA
jgi:8-amino-7-oxononanoate synthase